MRKGPVIPVGCRRKGQRCVEGIALIKGMWKTLSSKGRRRKYCPVQRSVESILLNQRHSKKYIPALIRIAASRSRSLCLSESLTGTPGDRIYMHYTMSRLVRADSRLRLPWTFVLSSSKIYFTAYGGKCDWTGSQWPAAFTLSNSEWSGTPRIMGYFINTITETLKPRG